MDFSFVVVIISANSYAEYSNNFLEPLHYTSQSNYTLHTSHIIKYIDIYHKSRRHQVL